MTARIYCPAKAATQSGQAKAGEWVLEFEPHGPRKIEPLMGYTASSDTMQQVRMKFPSAEAATAWCVRNGVIAMVQARQQPRRRKASYSDNFAFGRKTPWTH